MKTMVFRAAAGSVATCGVILLMGIALSIHADERPNIIFIMADDLGYGDLGCYGQEVIRTPYIDKLAQAGTRFTQVYSGSPVCAPARSVLMTGQHTGHTTVRGNIGEGGVKGLGGKMGRVPLSREDVTVAEVLKGAGYVTGITGKWGLGEPGTAGTPNKQGFDEWFGYLNQRRAHTYYPGFIWLNEERYPLPGNQDGRREQYTHDLFTEFALEFIDRHATLDGGQPPFFLYLAYTIPHAKYEIPSTDPYSDRDWDHDEKVHAAMVTRLDRDIGRIMASLMERGIEKRTVVFFCSDNGAARRWEGRFDSSGELRGRKRAMYEGGLRTPMIVRWPGRVPAGRVDDDATWYFADVLPTLAELAGAADSVPDEVDGVSVVPALLGRAQPELRDRYLYWEFFESGFQQAVRRDNWKAVRLEPGAPLELYDLSEDAGERHDIADQHPRVVEEIEAYLEEARTESKHWPLSS